MRKTAVFKEILLVGGGHSHVQVMKAFGMRPVAGVRLTLVARDGETPYSGMLPGLVGGHYERDECHVDLRRLAAATGVRLIKSEITGLDKGGRRVFLRDRPPLRYDLVSINVGASTALRVPGAAGRVTPVKPLDDFLATWASIIRRTQATGRPLRVVVIGGGAGGIELTRQLRRHAVGPRRQPVQPVRQRRATDGRSQG